MSDTDQLDERLEPLKRLLSGGQVMRVVARPGWVTVDRPGEISRVEISWDEESHRAAIADLEVPRVLSSGTTAAAVAGAIVLRRPPDPLRRIEDLASDGWLSSLAARTLNHAVELGCNIMLVGPWPVCVQLVGALLTDGARAAVVGGAGDAVPPGWLLLDDAGAAATVGADRVGAWSLDAHELGELMASRSSVVGWIDAVRLERALMRFEAAAEGAAGGGAPLAVLTAIDLVVVVAPTGEPRVRTVAEIDLAEDGYRPRPLFASGRSPVPTALVPVGVPSFVASLADAGYGVLADELRHAVGEVAVMPQPEPAVAWSEDAAPSPPAQSSPMPIIERANGAASEPLPDPTLADAPPPGWELDQLPEEELEVAAIDGSADDAAMAATFGLAPPPRPSSVSAQAGSLVGNGTFQDALVRARDRDEQMNREFEQSDESTFESEG